MDLAVDVGWAARAATDTTSVDDVIVVTGQRVIAVAARIRSYTQPALGVEDELVEQRAHAVPPSSAIAMERLPWEVASDAGSRVVGAVLKALGRTPRVLPGVPR